MIPATRGDQGQLATSWILESKPSLVQDYISMARLLLRVNLSIFKNYKFDSCIFQEILIVSKTLNCILKSLVNYAQHALLKRLKDTYIDSRCRLARRSFIWEIPGWLKAKKIIRNIHRKIMNTSRPHAELRHLEGRQEGRISRQNQSS